MWTKVRNAALLGLTIILLVLGLAGCKLGSTDSATAAKPSAGASAPGTTTVVNDKGQRVTVPFVSGQTVANGDTRGNTSMPSLHKLLPDCGVLVDWSSLVSCVEKHKAQWYIDGVNARKGLLGFDWATIKKWAVAKTPTGQLAEVRVIQVYKLPLSDAQARAAVAPLVGANVAKTLQVVRYGGPAFMNTWRTSGSSPSMTTFADYNAEVRVTLAPVVLNAKGQVIGIPKDVPGGVFVDCYNPHGFFPIVPPTPTGQPVCPPGTSMAGKPVPAGGVNSCTPPGKPGCKTNCIPTTPGCHTNCAPPPCKVKCLPGKDPRQNPNHSNSGGDKYGSGAGPAQTDPQGPPKGGQPPATYAPPPAPEPTHTSRPDPVPPPEPPAPKPSNPAPPGDPCKANPPPDWC